MRASEYLWDPGVALSISTLFLPGEEFKFCLASIGWQTVATVTRTPDSLRNMQENKIFFVWGAL
jgi:hypothetical protein